MTIRNYPLIDQYGNAIPDDLVVIPDLVGDEETFVQWFSSLNAAAKKKTTAMMDEHVMLVTKAKWYEIGQTLLVSAAEVQHLSEDTLEDAGIILAPESTLMLIDRPLKRWNINDGFYHA